MKRLCLIVAVAWMIIGCFNLDAMEKKSVTSIQAQIAELDQKIDASKALMDASKGWLDSLNQQFAQRSQEVQSKQVPMTPQIAAVLKALMNGRQQMKTTYEQNRDEYNALIQQKEQLSEIV